MNCVTCQCNTRYTYPACFPFHDYHYRLWCFRCRASFTPRWGKQIQSVLCSNSACVKPLPLFHPAFTSKPEEIPDEWDDKCELYEYQHRSVAECDLLNVNSSSAASQAEAIPGLLRLVRHREAPAFVDGSGRAVALNASFRGVSCPDCSTTTLIPPAARAGVPILADIEEAYRQTVPSLQSSSLKVPQGSDGCDPVDKIFQDPRFNATRPGDVGMIKNLQFRGLQPYIVTVRTHPDWPFADDDERIIGLLREYDRNCEDKLDEFYELYRGKSISELAALGKEWEGEITIEDAIDDIFREYYWMNPHRAPSRLREDLYVKYLASNNLFLNSVEFSNNEPSEVKRRQQLYHLIRAEYGYEQTQELSEGSSSSSSSG